MANKKHLEILKKGVKAWNEWRKNNPEEKPDLSGAYLIGTNLNRVNLRGANLSGANLSEANLIEADLREANLKEAVLNGADISLAYLNEAVLRGAYLREAELREAYLIRTDLGEADLKEAILWGADLIGATLRDADLRGAYLREADLNGADLFNANLTDSNLQGAHMIGTNLESANLSGCKIYGVSAWDVKLNEKTKQKDLIITPERSFIITVDNLEVAQFIYLLLHNEKIRRVIDTITTKVVLILGRFTPERKAILDAVREELRKHDYIPVLFDFEKPASKDIHETVITLANLAKFIIADITSPKSIPQELTSIVPNNPSLPVMPILKKGSKPWSMFGHIKKFPWVLAIHRYRDLDDLMATLKEKVIAPAEAKVLEVRSK